MIKKNISFSLIVIFFVEFWLYIAGALAIRYLVPDKYTVSVMILIFLYGSFLEIVCLYNKSLLHLRRFFHAKMLFRNIMLLPWYCFAFVIGSFIACTAHLVLSISAKNSSPRHKMDVENASISVNETIISIRSILIMDMISSIMKPNDKIDPNEYDDNTHPTMNKIFIVAYLLMIANTIRVAMVSSINQSLCIMGITLIVLTFCDCAITNNIFIQFYNTPIVNKRLKLHIYVTSIILTGIILLGITFIGIWKLPLLTNILM